MLVASGILFASLVIRVSASVAAVTTGRQQNQSRLVLEQSILTRAIGIEAPNRLVELLDTMPSGVVPRDATSAKTRAALWSLFFHGSMTKLARVPSPLPLIAFYNPIADVAVIQGCKVNPVSRAVSCPQACAVPGEVLSGEPPGLSPSWVISSEPIEAVQRITGGRMRAFAATNPAGSPEVVHWRDSYCSSEFQTTAERRLISLASMVGQIDPHKILAAGIDYVTTSAKIQAAKHSTNVPDKPDTVIDLLAHLKELSISGAATGPAGNWIIFWTPKHNGWHDAVLYLATKADGSMRILGGRAITLSSLTPG
jgi:hypothetical protein